MREGKNTAIYVGFDDFEQAELATPEKNLLRAPRSEPTAFFLQGQFSILWSTVCVVSTILETNSSMVNNNFDDQGS